MNIQGRGILFKYSHHCFFLFSIIVLQILVLKNLRKEGKKILVIDEQEILLVVFSAQFSSVAQSCPTLCDPMNAGHQASLSITNSQSPPKPMSIESVMPSNRLILCCPLLLCPQSFPASGSFQMSQLFASGGPFYLALLTSLQGGKGTFISDFREKKSKLQRD